MRLAATSGSVKAERLRRSKSFPIELETGLPRCGLAKFDGTIARTELLQLLTAASGAHFRRPATSAFLPLLGKQPTSPKRAENDVHDLLRTSRLL
jgi:hypothetical protein